MTAPENNPALENVKHTEVQNIEQLEQEQQKSNSSDWSSGIDVVEIAMEVADVVVDFISEIDLSG